MPLLLKPELVRVELTTPGEWVDIKARLSKGDQAKISAASFRVQASMSRAQTDPAVDMGLDYEASVFAGLEVGLMAWSFPEPVTPANIRALSSEDYDVITERANELWSPRKEEDTKNLSEAPAMPSGEKDQSPQSLAGS